MDMKSYILRVIKHISSKTSAPFSGTNFSKGDSIYLSKQCQRNF